MRKYFLFLFLALILAACAGTPARAYTADDPLGAFERLKTDVAATKDVAKQQELVAEFLKAYPQSPLIQGDKALFLVEDEASSVMLTGDMSNWFKTIPMERVGQTTLWATTQTFPPTARLEYKFGTGGGGRRGIFNDPRNPLTISANLGTNSELRMPDYVPPAEIVPRAGIPTGKLEMLGLYKSRIASTTHDLNVYLPPGYDPAVKYPSVYFQDGDDYLKYATTPTILDNAIADGILPPLIAVFVTPSEEQGRQVDYDLNNAYAEFFATELVSMIDAKYSTLDDPAQRVVVGDSYGGLISVYIGVLYPDTFGGVLNQSGFIGRQGGQLLTLFAVQPPYSSRIATTVGTFETCVGGPITGAECNFLEANRTLRDLIEANGIAQNYAEYPQGHAWAAWRDHIDRELAWVLNWKQ
jgi:enterochelin esterase family protein